MASATSVTNSSSSASTRQRCTTSSAAHMSGSGSRAWRLSEPWTYAGGGGGRLQWGGAASVLQHIAARRVVGLCMLVSYQAPRLPERVAHFEHEVVEVRAVDLRRRGERGKGKLRRQSGPCYLPYRRAATVPGQRCRSAAPTLKCGGAVATNTSMSMVLPQPTPPYMYSPRTAGGVSGCAAGCADARPRLNHEEKPLLLLLLLGRLEGALPRPLGDTVVSNLRLRCEWCRIVRSERTQADRAQDRLAPAGFLACPWGPRASQPWSGRRAACEAGGGAGRAAGAPSPRAAGPRTGSADGTTPCVSVSFCCGTGPHGWNVASAPATLGW
jgi:hypothetical protein